MNVVSRRTLVSAGAAALAGMAMAAEPAAGKVKVLGISCSLRKGKTTAAALAIALDSAKEAGADVELIELAGMDIDPARLFNKEITRKDDFPELAAKLTDPATRGILIGSPVYMSGPSSLFRALCERCSAMKRTFALRDKVGGAIAVGGAQRRHRTDAAVDPRVSAGRGHDRRRRWQAQRASRRLAHERRRQHHQG